MRVEKFHAVMFRIVSDAQEPGQVVCWSRDRQEWVNPSKLDFTVWMREEQAIKEMISLCGKDPT